MKITRFTVAFVCAMFIAAPAAHAQFGGLIKKAKDAAEKIKDVRITTKADDAKEATESKETVGTTGVESRTFTVPVSYAQAVTAVCKYFDSRNVSIKCPAASGNTTTIDTPREVSRKMLPPHLEAKYTSIRMTNVGNKTEVFVTVNEQSGQFGANKSEVRWEDQEVKPNEKLSIKAAAELQAALSR